MGKNKILCWCPWTHPYVYFLRNDEVLFFNISTKNWIRKGGSIAKQKHTSRYLTHVLHCYTMIHNEYFNLESPRISWSPYFMITPWNQKSWNLGTSCSTYRKFMNFNTSCLKAQTGFFRLLMKGFFDHYILWPFDKQLIS